VSDEFRQRSVPRTPQSLASHAIREALASCPRLSLAARTCHNLLLILLLAQFLWGAIGLGLRVRRTWWERTETLRYAFDICNGLSKGAQAQRLGIVNTYDFCVADHGDDAQYQFDYAPLRLLVMTRWADWHSQFNKRPSRGVALNDAWNGRYEEIEPLLNFNNACELAAAVAVFCLLKLWTGRRRRAGDLDGCAAAAAISGGPGGAAPVLGRFWRILRLVCGITAGIIVAGWACQAAGAHAVLQDANILLLRMLRPMEAWVGGHASRCSHVTLAGLVFVALMSNPLDRWSWKDHARTLGAVAGGLLLWFNPAVIAEAHVWPQWDIWLVPFFFWALFLVSVDWWFSAGLLLAIGAMLKAQLLLVCPVFLLWPIFAGRPSAALRLLTGLLLGAAVIVAPWLLTYLPPGSLTPRKSLVPGVLDPNRTALPRLWDARAFAWVISVVTAAVLTPLICRGMIWRQLWRRWRPGAAHLAMEQPRNAPLAWSWPSLQQRLMAPKTFMSALRIFGGVVLALALITWPFHAKAGREFLGPSICLASLFVVAIPFITPRRQFFLAAFCAGVALFLCVRFFHGSDSWARLGIEYGTEHFKDLARPDVNNLPQILSRRYGWRLSDPVSFAGFHWHWNRWDIDCIPTIKQLLRTVFLVMVVLCGAGAALSASRRDKRLLVAFVAAWTLFFAFMPQMHQRYLLWAACASVLLIGVDVAGIILHVALVALAFGQIMHTLLRENNPSYAPGLLTILNGLHPDIGWAVVVIALVLLYWAVAAGGAWRMGGRDG